MLIDTDWRGPAPAVGAHPNVRNRAACDLNPLDISDPANACGSNPISGPISPIASRASRARLALALSAGVNVERADAAEWLAAKLAARAADAATIVYHSVFLQYPPREAREAIVRAIQIAGASATEEAPLAWVRLEPEALTDGVRDSQRMVVDLTTWPGGQRRVLAYTDGHVRSVEAL